MADAPILAEVVTVGASTVALSEGRERREIAMVKRVDEGEGRETQGMKELEELLGIVDAEKIKAGDVKKAPRGKALGKILARHLGKPVKQEEQGVRTMEELRKRLDSIDAAKKKGRLADLKDLERWLRQGGK